MNAHEPLLVKRPTGISGVDDVTRGGLPADGATLVMGEPGAGKTVLGLQILGRAVERGEGGVFLSFEESRSQVQRDAESFTWGRALRDPDRLVVLEGQDSRHTEIAGAFDLEALLAALDASAQRVGASWVVLDGIDRLLQLQPDTRTAVDQVGRIDEWARNTGRSVLLTGKHAGTTGSTGPNHLEGVEFLLSTVLVLSARVEEQRLNRRFRVAKYRGSSHAADALAMLIDDDGIHLPYSEPVPDNVPEVPRERVSSGIGRLDEILGGGFYRGSSTLISGQPGTAKTTLATAFAAAAGQRGERALFLSFDEFSGQIIRDTASVGIDLQSHIDSGTLRIHARAAWAAQVEEHYRQLLRQVDDFQPHCLVIDPISALLKSSGHDSTFIAIERILARARGTGITTVLTSLSNTDDPVSETTLSHASTLADTWIVLQYQAHEGERNRSLSVVKSRGTAHSNQVREVLISSRGVMLEEVFQYGSQVLMGTARLEKEREMAEAREARALERTRRQRDLERQIEQTRSRMDQAGTELEQLQRQLGEETAAQSDHDHAAERHHRHVLQRRGEDNSHSANAGGTEDGT